MTTQLIEHNDQQVQRTATALVINGQLPFEEFTNIGTYLRKIKNGYQWWFGDWMNYGIDTYGEEFWQALDGSDYHVATLQQYAWVARNVPPENRRSDVQFGHYANGIAALPPAEQPRWLDKVVDEGLTQQEMKVGLKSEKAARGEPVTFWLAVTCADLDDQNRLNARMIAEGRITKVR